MSSQNNVPPPPPGAAPYQLMQQNIVPMSNMMMNNNNNDFLFAQNAIPPAQLLGMPQQQLADYGNFDTSMMNCIPLQQNQFAGKQYYGRSSQNLGTPTINGFQNFLAHSLACGSNLKPNPAGKVSFSCNL